MKPRGTLLELCYARASVDARGIVEVLRAMREAGQVAEFVVEWALATHELGREVKSVDELVEVWRGQLKRTTMFRRLALFREFFPEYGDAGTPQPLADALIAAVRRRSESDLTAPAFMRTPFALA